MYNQKQHNQSLYNSSGTGKTLVSQDAIVFNNLSLQNEYFCISKTNFDSSHKVENIIYNRPLTDGVGELNHFFREKIVTFEGTIKNTSQEELNNQIDRIKKIILQNNKNLDYKVNGVIRRAKATCINPNSLFFREHYNLSFIPISLEFRVFGFFKEIVKQNLTLPGKTEGFIEEVYNMGSAKAEPIITIVFNTANSVDYIKFTNGDNFIELNETINPGDIIKIDTEEKIVTINDIEKDYTGTFTRITPGLNSFNLEINGDKNFDFNLAYFNTYL